MNSLINNHSFKREDFGEDFLWGTGAFKENSQGGGIENYKDEIQLLKKLGITNYKFCLSWCNIIPDGTGTPCLSAIKLYVEILDHCFENNIQPIVTLFQKDLPSSLTSQGGWANREILVWFENYVEVCMSAFGHRIKHWIVLNDPAYFTGVNYFVGLHTPFNTGINYFLPALHHALLCQAIGFNCIKRNFPNALVGTTYSCTYIKPKTFSDKDLKATERVDVLLNRVFIEPTLGLGYPITTVPFLKHISKYFLPGDEALIKVDFDFIELHNYTNEVVEHNSYVPYCNAKIVPLSKRKVDDKMLNWEVYSIAIYYLILKYSKYIGIQKILITENGTAFFDEKKQERINDKTRIDYIKSYLKQLLNAKRNGGKVYGYFIGSLNDNFDTENSRNERLGLSYFNEQTSEYVIKDSGYWYRDFIESK